MPPNINQSKSDANNNEHLDANTTTTTSSHAKTCRACGTQGVKNRCGACKRVYFCDRECQKQIWVAHRPECARLIAETQNALLDASNAANASNDDATESNRTNNASNADATASNDANASIDANKSNEAPTCPALPSSPKDKKKAVVLVAEPDVIPPPAVASPSLDDVASPLAKPSSSSSKKKKHKKKKARSMSLHAPASAPMAKPKLKSRSQSLSAKKHVVWGEVRAREFTRFPGGGGAVPYDGSWALGLGSPVQDVQLGSVMEVEELRLEALEARAKELSKSQRSKVREGETRQFDYKSGVRNPLFGRLSERERRRLFSESEANHLHELEEQVAHRKRSMSCESSSPVHVVEHEDPLEADFACVASEQLNEFAVIRDSRDDSCGCSCGDLLKKVMKMNAKKLQGFLSERNVKLSGHSKPELLAQAKAIAAREKNCSNSAHCECARNGVGCHANVCVGCAGDCYNPHAQYAYNKDKVLQYRKQQIAKWNEAHADDVAAFQPQQHKHHSICVA